MAIFYVAAQISLLGAAKNRNEPGAPAGVLAHIQRALETDRFGFVGRTAAALNPVIALAGCKTLAG